MKKNLFEMGANFDDNWSSDNKDKNVEKPIMEIKPPQKHQLYFSKEKRRGKVVTIVQPFCLETNELKAVLKTLKKKLGTGGTLRENSLEFQGEVTENLKVQLQKLNFGFKN